MQVSFIIPHKGREELLMRTLQSIVDLDSAPHSIEIIIVTQNKTLDKPSFIPDAIKFQIVFRSESYSISSLRNTGVEHTSGEYLAFLDADVLLSQNWLQVMLEGLRHYPERVLMSATQHYMMDAGAVEKIRSLLYQVYSDNSVEFLGGANLFLTRTTFTKTGGFPEHLTTCEDYYFTHQIAQLGQLYCTSEAFFIHLGEDKTYAELFKKEIWRGQSNLRSLGGRKVPLRELPSILIPFWHAFFVLLAIIATIIGRSNWGGGAVGMACLPIFLYAFRLYRLGSAHISFLEALRFYGVYFPARIIGILVGVFKIIKV